MKTNPKDVARRTAIRVATALTLLPLVSRGFDKPVHHEIARSAFRSSSGVASFLSDQLGPSWSPFTNGPALVTRASDYPANQPDTPMGWLSWGAYMEDDEDPDLLGYSLHSLVQSFLRGCPHPAVAHRRHRVPLRPRRAAGRPHRLICSGRQARECRVPAFLAPTPAPTTTPGKTPGTGSCRP